jgi:hypothetical protein
MHRALRAAGNLIYFPPHAGRGHLEGTPMSSRTRPQCKGCNQPFKPTEHWFHQMEDIWGITSPLYLDAQLCCACIERLYLIAPDFMEWTRQRYGHRKAPLARALAAAALGTAK